jgi:hypothetical protein
MKGDGIFQKRQSGLYPPAMRKLLGSIGTEPITSLVVARAPIQSAVSSLLNLISGGTYKKAVAESPYDKMFHLALIINGKYVLDKQSVVSFKRGIVPNAETMNVAVPKNLTIQQLVDNTKINMGDANFSNYNSKTNNCQVFIKAILQSNHLLTLELEKFIVQDAQLIFSKMPSFTEKIANTLTDTGAIVDKLVEGEGWHSYYARHTRGKKFTTRTQQIAHMQRVGKAYRASKARKS